MVSVLFHRINKAWGLIYIVEIVHTVDDISPHTLQTKSLVML